MRGIPPNSKRIEQQVGYGSCLLLFTMPSRKQKSRAKRREEYLQNRDKELESSRVRYDANPEKKKAGVCS